MENEQVIITTDKTMLKEVLSEMFFQKSVSNTLPEFEGDRLSKPQTARLIGISIPTLNRQIKLGRFKQYNVGHRKYFLKSEVIASLRDKTTSDI